MKVGLFVTSWQILLNTSEFLKVISILVNCFFAQHQMLCSRQGSSSPACSLRQEADKLTCGRWHSNVGGRPRAPRLYCTRRIQRCACAGSHRIPCSSQTTVQSQEASALACHSQYTHGTAETDMQMRSAKPKVWYFTHKNHIFLFAKHLFKLISPSHATITQRDTINGMAQILNLLRGNSQRMRFCG